MSIAAGIQRILKGGFSADQDAITNLANELIRSQRGLEAHLARLDNTPLTIGAFLRGDVKHEINFAYYDATLAKAEKVLAANPGAVRIENGFPESFESIVESYRGALEAAAPYRKLPQ